MIIDKEVVWDKTQVLKIKTDKFGIIEYINDAYTDVSGYEDYELIGKLKDITHHPDMPKTIFKILQDNLRAGKNFHSVSKNLAKSGRYYWLISNYEFVENEDGEIVNYISKLIAVPDEFIEKTIEPLYRKLLQIEKTAGVLACEKYLLGFLEDGNNTYNDFVLEALAPFKKHKSENILHKILNFLF